VNRIRYAPEVASRPDRLAKDLANAKTLATLLEDEAAKLRSVKLPLPPPAFTNGDDTGVKKEDSDVTMTVPDEEDEESEPKERGSDAVERRIEKVMADLREQGVIDVNDEKAYEEKKVCSRCSFLIGSLIIILGPPFFFGRWWYRSICTLRIFGLHSTRAITALLLPIISKNCSVSV
jgi:hypothetical protein